MKRILDLPHRREPGTCYINGLYDLLSWHGVSYEYYLLPVIGGMAGFAYMQFKMVDPPRMVYWGNSPQYLLKELAEVVGYEQVVSEGKAWKSTFPQIIEALNNDTPVVVGALDMYYLHYYAGIYQGTHIPIHYVLIVGFDDEARMFYLHDCSFDGIQEVPFDALEQALAVNVPGMSKRNTVRVFGLPPNPPDEIELVRQGLAYKANRMLHPPVSMIGIPAMRKLAREIISWDCRPCIEHMVGYAGDSPPLVPQDLSRCNGLRFKEAELLATLGGRYHEKKYVDAAKALEESGNLIVRFCSHAMKDDLKTCGELMNRIADVEEAVFRTLE